ncbi:hypothetical protein V6N13_051018 [Hibiscus sabdariffa]
MARISAQSSSINAPRLSDESVIGDHLHDANLGDMNHRSGEDEPSPVIGEVVGTVARSSGMELEAEQLPSRMSDMMENGGSTQGYSVEDSHVSSSHENEPIVEAQNKCQMGAEASRGESNATTTTDMVPEPIRNRPLLN